MKFKGKSTKVSLDSDKNLIFILEGLEQIDSELLADTKNSRVQIEKTSPNIQEQKLKICTLYNFELIKISDSKSINGSDIMIVSSMCFDKGLGLIEYIIEGQNTKVTLTLPSDFDTNFELGEEYFIHWELTN